MKTKRNKRYTKKNIEHERGHMRGLFYYIIVELFRENRNLKPHEFIVLAMETIKAVKLSPDDEKEGIVYAQGKPSFSLPDAMGWAFATFAMFDGLTDDTDFMKVMEKEK